MEPNETFFEQLTHGDTRSVSTGVNSIENKRKLTGKEETLSEAPFDVDSGAIGWVEALEQTIMLMPDRQVLLNKITEDPDFKVRFYNALAKMNACGLQEINQKISTEENLQKEIFTGNTHGIPEVLTDAVEKLQATFSEAEKIALQNRELRAEEEHLIRNQFTKFSSLLQHVLQDSCGESIAMRKKAGAWVQQEILPYILNAEVAKRSYFKSRGHAGDYLSIEWISQNEASGDNTLGVLLDRCLLDMPAARAVRNRRALLREEIAKIVTSKCGEPVGVTSLACGPARELLDVYAMLSDPRLVTSTLLDIDGQALQAVKEKTDLLNLSPYFKFHNANLILLAIGRHTIHIEPQDLVYSMGLIDYLNDKYVVLLLNYIYKILKPGGKVILGNFHPNNQNKALMDYILNWQLIHRTEEEMHRLFKKSAFKKNCSQIRFEAQGINLFAECIK